MDFKLSLDYDLRDDDKGNDKSSCRSARHTTAFLVGLAKNAKYKDGSKDASIQRQWAKIERTLARAVASEKDTVEFDLEQVKAIRDALDEWQAPAGIWLYLEPLREYVADAVKTANAAAEKK